MHDDMIRQAKLQASAEALVKYVAPYSDPIQAANVVMNLSGLQAQAVPMFMSGPQLPTSVSNNATQVYTAVQNVPPGRPLPPPSGKTVTANFVCADGSNVDLEVDRNYVGILHDISVAHMGLQNPFVSPPDPNSFTLEEIGNAADIIEDLIREPG
jgi:hypothetical protein